jgi:hypothetical protein
MDWMTRVWSLAKDLPTQPPVQWVVGGPFPGGKVRPGCDADHSPPSSAEVVSELELYILSPKRLHGV